MDIKTQILDSVLRKYAKSDKELFSSAENISEEEFKEKLIELNLSDLSKRNSFFWELQLVVEKCVFNQVGSDDNESLAEMVVKTWNETNELKINQSLALSFIYIINLKFPNTRKAFIAICDGDLQSYKTFSSNKSWLFNDLLVRFLACICGKQQYSLVLPTVEQIMPLLFESTSKSDYRESVARVGFKHKKGLNFVKMSAYRKIVGVNDLVYAEGMKSILLGALNEIEETEVLSTLKQRLNSVVEIVDQNDSEEDFGMEDLLDNHAPEVNTQNSLSPKRKEGSFNEFDEAGVSVAVNEEVSRLVEREKQTEASLDGPPVLVKKLKDELHNEIVAALDNALTAVKSAIVKASELSNTQSLVTQDSDQNQLKIAKEEIDRLKQALQQEKEKVELAEEKAFVKVLNAIGGESSNYLLSDLFEESQGKAPISPNISAGRLINLFSSLSLAIGLEEHSNNYELGSVIEINKDELIKNYSIDGPIVSQNDSINVKLLKFGWAINGKVVVQPLVTEVKEEM
ncbi:hypothetical protein [Bacillus sp. S/N-304-OC-R1]|uniref:hypothetical protein n=1 Tax=Bacillus sp. S/N-304-OC-R1 TaxID=2758034 RepID=UPI001C8ECB58|nr:hypothetical protein [Bacillus sp. S/N-304-OC-R1]MBY0124399.1 hypothetical protein [Bacillus sp. S/N-304-OC-R1]